MNTAKAYRLILLLLIVGFCLMGCEAIGNRATIQGTVTGVYESSIKIGRAHV